MCSSALSLHVPVRPGRLRRTHATTGPAQQQRRFLPACLPVPARLPACLACLLPARLPARPPSPPPAAHLVQRQVLVLRQDLVAQLQPILLQQLRRHHRRQVQQRVALRGRRGAAGGGGWAQGGGAAGGGGRQKHDHACQSRVLQSPEPTAGCQASQVLLLGSGPARFKHISLMAGLPQPIAAAASIPGFPHCCKHRGAGTRALLAARRTAPRRLPARPAPAMFPAKGSPHQLDWDKPMPATKAVACLEICGVLAMANARRAIASIGAGFGGDPGEMVHAAECRVQGTRPCSPRRRLRRLPPHSGGAINSFFSGPAPCLVLRGSHVASCAAARMKKGNKSNGDAG